MESVSFYSPSTLNDLLHYGTFFYIKILIGRNLSRAGYDGFTYPQKTLFRPEKPLDYLCETISGGFARFFCRKASIENGCKKVMAFAVQKMVSFPIIQNWFNRGGSLDAYFF